MAPAPPQHLVWVDPGGMSGLAMLDAGRFMADEHDWDRICRMIEQLCRWYGAGLHIGYERFTIGPATHKLSPQPEVYELPGVIKYLTRAWGCVLLKPALPEQRNAATPAMLKALGWWVPGKDDAQSASQHLLAWMIRENCLPHEIAQTIHHVR